MQSRRAFIQKMAAWSAASSISYGTPVQAGEQNGTKQAVAREPEIPPHVMAAGNQIVGQLEQEKWFRDWLGLKIAYCQHPMYLIIDEDRGVPPVSERTRPWGAIDAAEYIERIRRNLASFEKIPGLRLNFDFAALDLETIKRDYPDVVAQMVAVVNRNVVEFVNGGYSQSHLQLFSSESNWRDFEYGALVYKKLFNKQVTVYAFQESALHPQLPQLLKKFGYQMMVAPAFDWFLEITGGSLELMASCIGNNFMRGDEFVHATALDGTSLPFYLGDAILDMPCNLDNLKRIIDADMFGPPPVWSYYPDMNEIHDSSELCEFVLYTPALTERLRRHPPRAAAMLTSHWSYAEGVWAEELLRVNRTAEEHALMAESILAMGGMDSRGRLDHEEKLQVIWKTILKAHHHDVSWIEVTDLRRKMIQQLTEKTDMALNLAGDCARALVPEASDYFAVFNTVPVQREVVIKTTPDRIPGKGFQEFEGNVFGVCTLPAGGYRSFEAGSPVSSAERNQMRFIETRHYRVTLSENGLLLSIKTSAGEELLRADQFLGGELRALIDDKWVDNREAQVRYYDGPVCAVVGRSLNIGSIPVEERYFFFHERNAIKVEMTFSFSGDQIGYFWIDESKLNVYYPTVGGPVLHDVPFGFISAQVDRRPILAPNWVHSGGLTYVNRGNVKHWVERGVIANVIAWGGHTFDNRMHFDSWTNRQPYDLRLYGKQFIEYWLIPTGSANGASIVRDVHDLTFPTFIAPGRGSKSFYELTDVSIATTAVFHSKGEIWMRGYRLPSTQQSEHQDFEILQRPI
jgi:hypothetical protein